MTRHNHPDRMYAVRGQCVACDRFWDGDPDERLDQLMMRVASSESLIFQMRNELQTLTLQHKADMDERDNAVMAGIALAQAQTTKAREAMDSEILLRTNIERLAASLDGPLAERIRTVLDSYKEITA